MNKIDLMHRLFGKNESLMCCECKAFYRNRYGTRIYRKCRNYGDSASTGTDWKATYQACGLAPSGQYEGVPVVEIAKQEPRTNDDTPLEGQMILGGAE